MAAFQPDGSLWIDDSDSESTPPPTPGAPSTGPAVPTTPTGGAGPSTPQPPTPVGPVPHTPEVVLSSLEAKKRLSKAVMEVIGQESALEEEAKNKMQQAMEASPHAVGTKTVAIISWLQPKLSQAMIMTQVAQS